MPRPESPIDPAWPLAEFACGLRALRNARNLGYRELAEKANYSTAVLSQAASGRSLPTWGATRAFVLACGGDEESWRLRYEAAAQKQRQQRGATPATNHKRGGSKASRIDSAEIARPSSSAGPPPTAMTSSAYRQYPPVPEVADIKDAFVHRLRRLRSAVGSPSNQELSKVATIPTSTMYDLLAGRFRRPPRWELVSGFVAACVQLGQRQGVSVPADLASLKVWRHHHTSLSSFLDRYAVVPSPQIRVLLAEDMDLVRTALVRLLSDEEDIEIVADMKCDRHTVSAAVRLQPDVVVVSADQPESEPLTIIRELRQQLPNCQLVALATKRPIGLLKHVLAADVSGLIDKNAPADRLLHAIRGVAQGGTVIDASLVVAALADSNPLTPRELAILRETAAGASGPEIAEQLSLSPTTVRNYLSNAMHKTGARSRIDAIRIATESGWL